MRLIDGRGHTRPFAMFDLDRGCETRIVRSQFKLQRAPTHGETLL